jgi:hypothetical protein
MFYSITFVLSRLCVCQNIGTEMLPNAMTVPSFEGGPVHFEDWIFSDVRNFFYSLPLRVSLLIFAPSHTSFSSQSRSVLRSVKCGSDQKAFAISLSYSCPPLCQPRRLYSLVGRALLPKPYIGFLKTYVSKRDVRDSLFDLDFSLTWDRLSL